MLERKARNSLQIFATPFKSSFLSIPPSPFSPRTPLTPPLYTRQQAQKPVQQAPSACSTSTNEAPSSPLAWLWRCHQCHHSYRLGVTRRCLEDGHHFCSGTTSIVSWRKPSNSRKHQNHRACPSEFDYAGWKTVGRWRRGGPRHITRSYTGSAANIPNKAPRKQDCWNTCDYPSECRWGKKFGIHTPVETVFPSTEVNSMPTLTTPVNTMPEGILKQQNCISTRSSRETVKTNLWAALSASAERRKNAVERGASPLSTLAEKSKTDQHVDIPFATRDGDGDVVMETIDPTLLDNANTPSPPSQPDSSSAVDSLEALVSRRRYRRVKNRSKTHGSIDKRAGESSHVVPEAVASRIDDQVRLDEADMLVEGFAPLCRVRSRGCSV
jgi:hypothetical protein